MSTESITLWEVIPATPREIYDAWLSSAHGKMTGSAATVDPRVGGSFTAWDGYISGATLELEPYRRIVQAWRTTEFPTGSPDSHLEILLEQVEGGTRITLRHTDIPEGQSARYEQGWIDHYFRPMKEYFAKRREDERRAAIAQREAVAAVAEPRVPLQPKPAKQPAAKPVAKKAAPKKAKKPARKAVRKPAKKAAAKKAKKPARKPARKAARKPVRKPAKKAAAKKAKKPARKPARKGSKGRRK